MSQRPHNWVFLGDSLTEGVGSSRVSYVNELASLLRQAQSLRPEGTRLAIHDFRLRRVDPDKFNRFVRVNTAGHWRSDSAYTAGALWLWNLACEGTTVQADLEWVPLLDNIRPERVFVHRGSLESIVRPIALANQSWPWWVPKGWRGYAAMDPRCYFSQTAWRRIKQKAIDRAKQRIRLKLLAKEQGAPLMDPEEIGQHLAHFLTKISGIAGEVFLIGLLPVGDETFPGSGHQFEAVNRVLACLARQFGVTFLDPSVSGGEPFESPSFYYSDRFHPNLRGARKLAAFIAESVDVIVEPTT